ncbi:MAG: SusC/RagA family TonB-linked outer membrane protein [Flavobacteriaceae bacterium]|nr:SusC/RagA family TonB-linked outer membrane protein [Flavobacteriaceae bacterium]
MKTKFNGFLTLLLAFVVQITFAQEKTVTGIVSDASGPLPGVTVIIKGTKTGTQTDFDGNYSIKAATGAVLQYSFIGYSTTEQKVGASNVLNVVMKESAEALEEVVVTALGISREKKSLGYSAQEVKGDEIAKTSNPDVISSLKGRMAGAEIITASGQVGASTTIKIRGNKTFYGNSSPLFVVDGTPIINQTNSIDDLSTDFGNTAADIDPNNIKSLTILKGASASALYGDRGLNGVVLITTKKGKKQEGFGVSYTGSWDFDNVYILPDYQNSYGQGGKGSEYWWKKNAPEMTYADYAATRFSWTPGNDWDESWGPRLDQGYNLVQFDSPVDGNGNKIATPWISHPNNVSDFYQTGVTGTNSVAISAGNDNATARFTITNTNQTGTSPNTDQKRLNLGLNTTMNLGKRLKMDINANFVNTNNDNIPQQGNSMKNALFEFNGWFARQVDTKYLKDHYEEMVIGGNGELTPLNWMTGYDTQHNNPYWIAYKNTTSRERKRVYGNIGLTYNLTKGIDLIARAGADIVSEHRKIIYHSGTKGYAFVSQTPPNGSFYEQFSSQSETNLDLMLNIDKKLGEDLTLTSVIGANYRASDSKDASVAAQNLVIPDFFATSNIQGQPIIDNNLFEYESQSVYSSANLGYKGFLYLGMSYRQDWSSSLAEKNWSFGYPSVNMGFIFSEILGLDKDVLTFGKLRASYSEVGNATSPYQLLATYRAVGSTFASQAGNVNVFSLSSTIPSFNLKPQRTESTEFGGEFKFLNNRLGLDLTYYSALTKDQIMSVPVSSGSGYSSWLKNAGKIKNQGIEIQLYATPIQQSNFVWNLNLNWSKNKNTVVSLDDGIDELIISSFYSIYDITLKAIPGQDWGTIYGSDWQKDDAGNVLISSSGLPITADRPQVIGNVNPDFVGGIQNEFTYKSFKLSFLVDFRKGGDIYSYTKVTGQKAGILQNTVDGDQRVNGMVAKGVYAPGVVDANGVDISGQTNSTIVAPYDYWRRSRSWASTDIVDGSFIKLRDVSLSYSLPRDFVSKLSMQSCTVSLYGRNLALLYTDPSNDVHIDPEVSTGGVAAGTGLEQYQLAPSRTLGFKLNVNF